MIIYDVVEKKAYPVGGNFNATSMTCDCVIAGDLNIGEGFATGCGKGRFAMLSDDGKALGDEWNWDAREGTARAAELLYKQRPAEIVEAMHRIDMLEQAIAIHREKTKRPVQADRDLWELIDSAAVVG